MEARIITFILFLKISFAFDQKQFINDISNHFGRSEIQLYEDDFDTDISIDLVKDLWDEGFQVRILNKDIIPKDQIPIFKFRSEDQNLQNVIYDKEQIWVVNEENLEIIEDWNLRLDSLVYLWTENDNGIQINEIYKIKGSMKIFQEVGKWTPEFGFIQHKGFIWERRSNLQGIELLDSVAFDPRYYNFDIDNDGNYVNTTGFGFDVIEILTKMLNLTRTVTSSEDGLWGAPDDNNDYNGIVGQVQRKEVDLCSVGLVISMARSSVVDFSISLVTDYGTIMRKV